MSSQNDSASFFFHMLSDIRPQFLQQKKQAVHLAEKMIQHRDFTYIPKILSCAPVGNYQLFQLDADMRRLKIVCEIVAAEEKLSIEESGFLENVASFGDLIQKYIRVTLLLRRLEFDFPETVMEDTVAALAVERISVCAIRKITSCETFADSEYVYNRALQIIGEN